MQPRIGHPNSAGNGFRHGPGTLAGCGRGGWRASSPHSQSPSRSCLRLVLCQSEFSFGILISLRLPVSHRGFAPDKITPMTGVHKKMQPSCRPRFRTWPVSRGNWLILGVRQTEDLRVSASVLRKVPNSRSSRTNIQVRLFGVTNHASFYNLRDRK